jgi:hypothetical protein
VASCIVLILSVIVICLARWFFQCAARSKADVHDSQSPPSLSSSPAGRGEREESLAVEADFDEMDYKPSGGEDDEADGDGDDYPSEPSSNKKPRTLSHLPRTRLHPQTHPAKPPPPIPTPTPRGCLYGISSS